MPLKVSVNVGPVRTNFHQKEIPSNRIPSARKQGVPSYRNQLSFWWEFVLTGRHLYSDRTN